MKTHSGHQAKVATVPEIKSIALQTRSSQAVCESVRVEAGSGQRV